MDERIVGQNIRALRESRGLSLTLAAAKAGMSKGTLSKIETARISPPISTLLAVANALGVHLSRFFIEPGERPPWVLTRKGEAPRMSPRGPECGYAYRALALNMPDKDVEPFLLTVRPTDRPVVFQHGGQEFIYMLSGTRPSPMAAHAMDVALTLHADHELNASTFAARVAAATLTDIHSAAVAGIATLKGPLHGGANAEVMKMLIEIGKDAPGERIDSYVKGKFARKEKISGFGHRVYRTEDPRATHLRQFSKQLGQQAGNLRWFAMSERIEALVKDEKKLYPNVDFYSASMYYTMGIAIDLYTPIFAVSRISGWTAHVLEQLANNRLIRPRADYTGPAYPQTWRPVDQR